MPIHSHVAVGVGLENVMTVPRNKIADVKDIEVMTVIGAVTIVINDNFIPDISNLVPVPVAINQVKKTIYVANNTSVHVAFDDDESGIFCCIGTIQVSSTVLGAITTLAVKMR